MIPDDKRDGLPPKNAPIMAKSLTSPPPIPSFCDEFKKNGHEIKYSASRQDAYQGVHPGDVTNNQGKEEAGIFYRGLR
jgi:hypothetical protein